MSLLSPATRLSRTRAPRGFSHRLSEARPRVGRVGPIALVAAAAGVLLSGACGGRPAAPPTIPLVRIEARDFAFSLPDTVPAGLVRLRLVDLGTQPHQAILTRLDPGESAQAHVASVEQFQRGGAFPGWSDDPGGPGVVSAGDSSEVIVELAPGHYMVACYVGHRRPGPDHAQRGMVREFEVVAAPGEQPAAPAADLTIELMDYTFRLSAPITAGPHIIHVINRGPQEHELQIARVLPGHTGKEAVAWLESPAPGLPAPIRAVGGLNGLAPKKEAYVVTTLTPGDYLIGCGVPDSADARPHFAHGMVYAVHVD